MSIHHINPEETLSMDDLHAIVAENKTLVLSPVAISRIEQCRRWIDEKMKANDAPIYGINTGFGSLCDTSIDTSELEQLQLNIVMSHACGAGEEVPTHLVKLMMLLKVQGLSYGKSGSQVATVVRLVDMYNANLIPVVYQLGSLGASGDLAPLAHLSLPLLGMGEVDSPQGRISGKTMLEQQGWEAICLGSKEGLALLNGTQFMNAYGSWSLLRARQLCEWADLIGALSLEGYDGRPEPFHPAIHEARPHTGQKQVAANLRRILNNSELIQQQKAHVQDPYSFRCMPQVHGATRDAINHIQNIFTTEINSVTDNPTVFVESDEVISAGNFHGQPLAINLDYMAIALAELGSISERRTYKLISGTRGLPAFLVANPGLNSGFMIPQYTAASIVSQNKQLCMPASVDTIDSSNGQEDHVSMGANAATKCKRVVDNVERILAIELMNAAQAMHFRKPLKSSPILEKLLADYRATVPFVENDRYLKIDMDKSIAFIQTADLSHYLAS